MEIKELIEQFIINYGLISIFIIVALEYANIPLPSELVLPLVGILALKFNMNILLVILVTILGGIVGSIINYYLGYKFGKPLISIIKNKYPKSKKSIRASYKWMAKYEKISVMLSRVIPLARTFISIIAGVAKMNVYSFIIYSTIGISIWNTALLLMGYILGENINYINTLLKEYSIIIFIIIFIGTLCSIRKIKFKIKK